MAAGAPLAGVAGSVLLADPVYRGTWDLPGGAAEGEEFPYAACRREVAEEPVRAGQSRLAGNGQPQLLSHLVPSSDEHLLDAPWLAGA